MNGLIRPPKLAEDIIAYFAGPYLEEEICGDLFERFSQGKTNFWYWTQVIRSIPKLCAMHLSNQTPQSLYREGIFILLVISFMCFWELSIARKSSWPIARSLLDYSPLSPTNSCKAIYVMLYGTAVVLGIAAVKRWSKKWERSSHFKRTHILFFGLLAFAIPLYLYINPGPYDGNRDFRVCQILIVWSATAFLFIDPKLSFPKRFRTLKNRLN